MVRAKEEGKNEQEAKVKHGSSSSVRIEVTLYFSFVSEERKERDVDATPALQHFQTCAKKSSLSASNNSLPL